MSNIYQLLSRSPEAIFEVEALVRAGADLHDRSMHISKRTVVEMAAASSHPAYADVIRRLVALGADVNSAHPASALTALHNAARYAPVETIRVLCELGADPNARDSRGRTPAFLVLERTAPVNVPDQMRAALEVLFDAGGNSLAKDNNGKTLLASTGKAEFKTIIRSAQMADRIVGAIDKAAALPDVPVTPAAGVSRKSIEPL